MILHDTVLFPEGGGQPSDVGILRTANNEEYEVVEVKRRGGHAIHFVKAKGDNVPGLEVGAQVTAALGEAGYSRRLDHVCSSTNLCACKDLHNMTDVYAYLSTFTLGSA